MLGGLAEGRVQVPSPSTATAGSLITWKGNVHGR